MNLTKGQKDALARRAQKIVDEKVNAKKESLKKAWVPTPEEQEYLHNVEIVVNAIEKAKEVGCKAGFQPCYSGFEIRNGVDCRTLYFNGDNSFETIKEDLSERWARQQMQKEVYPTWDEVVDEVELLTMSKDFDVDAFLKKYQDL